MAQVLLVVAALISVPIMLLPKPLSAAEAACVSVMAGS